MHLVFSKGRLAAIETFSLSLAEYQTQGQIRAWSYPGSYLGSMRPGEEGGPLALWLDVAVERLGVSLVRRISERAIVLNGKRP